MARLYMVRHGRALAGFGESMDPDLDSVGRQQAEEVASQLLSLGPIPILSSPLARARATAAHLAKSWRCEATIEPAVAEIPSPTNDLQKRVQWLRQFMAGSWRNASPPLAEWRENVIAALVAQSSDSVIFSHFIAINVAVGAALGDDRVVVFSPDNCSVTVLKTEGNRLQLIEKGSEAALTRVN